MSILVVGNAVLDMTYRVRCLPRPGETLLASARTIDVGGKGLNQAVAARRAGAEVRLVAPVGRDEAAQRIRDVLAAEGLDPTLLVVVDAPTDEAVIWVGEDGENAIVSTADAARRLLPAGAATVAGLGPSDTLLMQGNLPAETMARCLEAARGCGARLVVNTAPFVPGAELLVPIADVLVVNAGEAMGLSGASEPEAAAEALVSRGVGSVVVTLGAAGAYLLSGGTRRPRSPRLTRPGPATCSPACWRRCARAERRLRCGCLAAPDPGAGRMTFHHRPRSRLDARAIAGASCKRLRFGAGTSAQG